MEYKDFIHYMENTGKDPSQLIFEDELTGIYNRRFLLNHLQTKVRWDNLREQPLSLIMIDVDHFKQINDTQGHQVGDKALIWVSENLKAVTTENDYSIRYAGDEFMILLQNSDKQAALKTGEKFIQRVHENQFRPDNQDKALSITLSLGIASAPADAKSGKALIHQADTALYYAKKKGRDCLASAGEFSQEDVFSKKAIYQLESLKWRAGKGSFPWYPIP